MDCSNTGTGLFKSKLYIKNVKEDQMITAKFDIPVSVAVRFPPCPPGPPPTLALPALPVWFIYMTKIVPVRGWKHLWSSR